MTEPCQPIGCDADIHLPGCEYTKVDNWPNDIIDEETGITVENSSGTQHIDPNKVF